MSPRNLLESYHHGETHSIILAYLRLTAGAYHCSPRSAPEVAPACECAYAEHSSTGIRDYYVNFLFLGPGYLPRR